MLPDTGSPCEYIPHKHHLPPKLDHPACLEKARSWITRCEQDHPTCKHPSPPHLPTRVIEVGEEASSSACRLHISDKGERCEYLALTHCWGDGADVPKLTRASVERYQSRIDPAVLSNTFTDALHLTRRLGFRYIWIDALCITQDDEEDWAVEAGKMASVYGNAYLTIAAASSEDGTGGCFYVRKEVHESRLTSVPGKQWQVFLRQSTDHTQISPLGGNSSLKQYPLSRRKWCFQEWVLSRRMLFFTEHELFWECKTEQLCECERGPMPFLERKQFKDRGVAPGKLKEDYASLLSPPDREEVVPRRHASELWRLWDRLVSEYTARRLSHETDILPAFSAIARDFAHVSLGQYCAGIWTDHLPDSLCWRPSARRYCRRSSKYCAPSWSWASVQGRIDLLPWHRLPAEPSPHDARVISIACKPRDSDEFGRLDGGVLELSAYCVESPVRETSSNHAVTANHRPENLPDTTSLLFDSEDDIAGTSGESIWLVAIRWHRPDNWCLVLRSNGDDTFRRVGSYDSQDVRAQDRYVAYDAFHKLAIRRTFVVK